jgi:hypothetical protein
MTRTAIGLLKETRAKALVMLEEVERTRAVLSELEMEAAELLKEVDIAVREAEKDPACGMPIGFEFVGNPDD